MQALSKSKLLAYRQCPKRLWLEVHCPTLQQYSAKAQARFAEGHLVGQIARQLYAPAGGRLINIAELGVGDAITATARLLATPEPIFEAGFQARGALAFADVLLPLNASGPTQWRMIEVKSSTGVKPHQRDDAAVQHYVAREAGIAITQVVIAHIDNRWKYPGGNDYRGLLVEVDVTQESLDRHSEVEQWIEAEMRRLDPEAYPAAEAAPQPV